MKTCHFLLLLFFLHELYYNRLTFKINLIQTKFKINYKNNKYIDKTNRNIVIIYTKFTLHKLSKKASFDIFK